MAGRACACMRAWGHVACVASVLHLMLSFAPLKAVATTGEARFVSAQHAQHGGLHARRCSQEWPKSCVSSALAHSTTQPKRAREDGDRLGAHSRLPGPARDDRRTRQRAHPLVDARRAARAHAVTGHLRRRTARVLSRAPRRASGAAARPAAAATPDAAAAPPAGAGAARARAHLPGAWCSASRAPARGPLLLLARRAAVSHLHCCTRRWAWRCSGCGHWLASSSPGAPDWLFYVVPERTRAPPRDTPGPSPTVPPLEHWRWSMCAGWACCWRRRRPGCRAGRWPRRRRQAARCMCCSSGSTRSRPAWRSSATR